MAIIQKLGSALLAVTMAVTLVGCGQNAKNNAAANNGENTRLNTLESSATKTNRASAGVLCRHDIDNKLNTVAGLRNSTVLVHDGNAFVGVINVGKEHAPDAAMQAGDTWNDMPWGTAQRPNSATGMTVQQMQAESLEPANTHDGPYSTITGNIDDATKKQITDIVRSNVKGVNNVYITGNVQQVQKLSGYKHYIARGGNMTPHLQEFNQFIQNSFGGTAATQQLHQPSQTNMQNTHPSQQQTQNYNQNTQLSQQQTQTNMQNAQPSQQNYNQNYQPSQQR
jgi:hypothetical protein